MAYVAELLDDGDGDGDATTDMLVAGFPPAAVVVFEVTCAWSDLGLRHLPAHRVPRRVGVTGVTSGTSP